MLNHGKRNQLVGVLVLILVFGIIYFIAPSVKHHAAEVDAIRRQIHTGRPLETDSFIARLETMAGRILRALPRGRPKKEK